MNHRFARLCGLAFLAAGASSGPAFASPDPSTAVTDTTTPTHHSATHHHRRHAAAKPAAPLAIATPPVPAAPPASSPAPVPNEAVTAPIDNTQQQTSVAPSVFQLHYPPQGNGYTTGSSSQALDDRDAAKATGVEVKVPLPQ